MQKQKVQCGLMACAPCLTRDHSRLLSHRLSTPENNPRTWNIYNEPWLMHTCTYVRALARITLFTKSSEVFPFILQVAVPWRLICDWRGRRTATCLTRQEFLRADRDTQAPKRQSVQKLLGCRQTSPMTQDGAVTSAHPCVCRPFGTIAHPYLSPQPSAPFSHYYWDLSRFCCGHIQQFWAWFCRILHPERQFNIVMPVSWKTKARNRWIWPQRNVFESQ